MALGSLLLRTAVGGFFVGHGLQKLRGDFGGPGLDGTTGFMESLGMRPARRNALAIAWTETAGGAAIVLGAATPVAATGLIAAMTTAVRKVHLSNGPWVTNGGYEYNAVLIAAVAALAADGPGPISVDALFGKAKWGAAAGVLAVAAGVAGSFAATEAAKRAPVSTDDAAEGATSESADPAI